MQIKIVKETTKDGQMIAEITSEDMLTRSDLPEEYYEHAPAVYKDNNGGRITYVEDDGEHNVIRFESAESLKDAIAHIQVSGERLHQIKKKIQQTRALWDGTTVLTI